MKQIKIIIECPVDVEKTVLKHAHDFETFLCKNFKVEFAIETDISDEVFSNIANVDTHQDDQPIVEKAKDQKVNYDWGV